MRWIWAFAWAALIFVTSSTVITTGDLSHAVTTASLGHVSDSGFREAWRAVWWILVKGWHAVEFGVLFLLVRRAMPNKSLAWAMSLPTIYAASDEAHQLFVPHRGCRVSDVCIDCLGILAAWLLTENSGRKVVARIAAGICILALYFLSMHPFGTVRL